MPFGPRIQIHQGRKGALGADVVGQEHDAALPAFDADLQVPGAVIVAAVEEAAALRTGEGLDAKPRAEPGEAAPGRQLGAERQSGRSDPRRRVWWRAAERR